VTFTGGINTLDQKGGGKSLAQTRLYVFLDAATETIHLITLGDKRSQASDIRLAVDFVNALGNRRKRSDDETEELEGRHGSGSEPGE
jgi:hypothetical protein